MLSILDIVQIIKLGTVYPSFGIVSVFFFFAGFFTLAPIGKREFHKQSSVPTKGKWSATKKVAQQVFNNVAPRVLKTNLAKLFTPGFKQLQQHRKTSGPSPRFGPGNVPCLATVMVSHHWRNRFVHLLAAVVAYASGETSYEATAEGRKRRKKTRWDLMGFGGLVSWLIFHLWYKIYCIYYS